MSRLVLQYETPPPPAAAGTAGTAVAAAVERRVFISYAHDDGARDGNVDTDLPRRFHQELLRLCEDHPEYGVRSSGIFFDRRGLLPGSDWRQRIAAALAGCDIVFFLVSSSSLSSPYCIDDEVGRAIAAGKCVVPVVLEDCRWDDRVVRVGHQRFRLGDFQAVPMDAQFKLRPVELWEHRNSAWRAVAQQIQSLLAAPPTPPGPLPEAALRALGTFAAGDVSAANGSAPARALAPGSAQAPAELLPFTCNQVAVARQFQLHLRPWQNQALLVLLKGVYDDEMPSFVRRLAELDLAPRCARAGLPLLQRRVVKDWPTDDDEMLPEYVRMALASALTGDPDGLADDLKDGSAMAAALAAQPGLRPLLLGVLEGGPVLAKALRAALALIESAAPAAPLQRLALVLTLEDPALVDDPDAAATLGLRDFKRTHIIELSRLRTLDGGDVAQWFDDNELNRHFSAGRPAFVQRLFEGRADLRMRPFAQGAQRLLQAS